MNEVVVSTKVEQSFLLFIITMKCTWPIVFDELIISVLIVFILIYFYLKLHLVNICGLGVFLVIVVLIYFTWNCT